MFAGARAKITPSTALSDVTVVPPSGGEVRAASLHFYRDSAIFCLARSVSDVYSGISARMSSGCRALHIFSIHMVTNASVFSFVRAASTTTARPSTRFSNAILATPPFVRTVLILS